MNKIYMDEATPEFAKCWQAAGRHLVKQADGNISSWLRANLEPPFLEHLSFRLGNQLFFIRVEDEEGEMQIPGNPEGFFSIAEGCNGYACVMPMCRKGDEWHPVLPGWGLQDARTEHLINPPELISDEKIEMTDWELHDFAVQVVRQSLEKEGKTLLTWQSNPSVDPAIWFEGAQGPEWVVVREVRYPQSDASLPENIQAIIDHCAEMSQIGYFASVAFINVDDPVDPKAAQNGNYLPLYRGYGANARYEGLKPITA